MFLGLDHIGIEGTADPFRELGVALVLRVGGRFEEIGIPPGTADVFGWRASASRRASRSAASAARSASMSSGGLSGAGVTPWMESYPTRGR